MAAFDDTTDGHAFIVLGARSFRLDRVLGVDVRCETLTRISP